MLTAAHLIVLAKAARAAGVGQPTPPPGFTPIEGSHFGGHEGLDPSGHAVHWYPSSTHAQRAITDHSLRAADEEYWADSFRARPEYAEGYADLVTNALDADAAAQRHRHLARLARVAMDQQALHKAATAQATTHAGDRAAFLVQTLKTLAHSVVAKPPAGFTPIPGSRHQGYHRQVGGRWVHWYPSAIHARHAAMHHAAERAKAASHEAEHVQAQHLMAAHHEQAGGKVSRYSEARDRFAAKARAAGERAAHHGDMAAGAHAFLDAHQQAADPGESKARPVPFTERLHHHVARLLGAVIALRGAAAATKRPAERQRRPAPPRRAADKPTTTGTKRNKRTLGGRDPKTGAPVFADGRPARAPAQRRAPQADTPTTTSPNRNKHVLRGHDPDTGEPRFERPIGYDPKTGAPVFADGRPARAPAQRKAPQADTPRRADPSEEPTVLARRPGLGDDEATELRPPRPINARRRKPQPAPEPVEEPTVLARRPVPGDEEATELRPPRPINARRQKPRR